MSKSQPKEGDFLTRSQALYWLHQYTDDKRLEWGRQPAAYIHSYGCQQNVADGETLEGMVLEMGYTLVPDAALADLILYNTCAVRENAEDRVFGTIGGHKLQKANNPHLVLGLCGCMIQQEHIFRGIRERYPYVDLLFGAGAMDTFPALLVEKLQKGQGAYNLENPTRPLVEELPTHRGNSFQAYLPIMSGCNNFCSYCVVPYVRGRERSRASGLVLKEATLLLQQGYKEITLLGQNVNSYKDGEKDGLSFPRLLAELAQLPYTYRLRFITSHPKDCTPELLDIMAANPNICHHLHLPVQSGSNGILKEMNRGYQVEDYIKLVDYARTVMPDLTLTSDLIVGFPGESEEDFQKTLDLVDRVGYSSLFTFAYSPRQGTRAAKLDGTLTQQEKTSRFQRLLALQRVQSNAYHKTLVGQSLKVLVEGPSSKDGLYTGRTEGSVLVLFPASPQQIGTIQQVRIENYYNWAIEGQIVQP